VRKSNQIAIDMYKQFQYVVYRTVLGYYSGDNDEDAYGKCLSVCLSVSCVQPSTSVSYTSDAVFNSQISIR